MTAHHYTTMAVLTGPFRPICLEPPTVRSLYGIVPSVYSAQTGVEELYKAEMATHRIVNETWPHRPQVLEVEVYHSRTLLHSAVHLYAESPRGRHLVAISHTVDNSTIPTPQDLAYTNDSGHNFRTISLNPRRGERAMVIKTHEGDWALVTAEWAGLCNGIPSGEEGIMSSSDSHSKLRGELGRGNGIPSSGSSKDLNDYFSPASSNYSLPRPPRTSLYTFPITSSSNDSFSITSSSNYSSPHVLLTFLLISLPITSSSNESSSNTSPLKLLSMPRHPSPGPPPSTPLPLPPLSLPALTLFSSYPHLLFLHLFLFFLNLILLHLFLLHVFFLLYTILPFILQRDIFLLRIPSHPPPSYSYPFSSFSSSSLSIFLLILPLPTLLPLHIPSHPQPFPFSSPFIFFLILLILILLLHIPSLPHPFLSPPTLSSFSSSSFSFSSFIFFLILLHLIPLLHILSRPLSSHPSLSSYFFFSSIFSLSSFIFLVILHHLVFS
ncbi:hypothetical protein C7M84_000523 [Penaeus vannamei]|uniref:Uncharacterized protein n=1 Tax=Penaeus vannamei TaxID=6689 RepID=A0A423TW89_PENVA|nr:hypothetical protein C7M84_000523 [Penaeus vannamei]